MKIHLLPTIKEILNKYPSKIDNRFGSAKRDMEDLLMHILNCSEAHLMAYSEQKLTTLQFAKFKSMLAKRKKGIPLQYIFGQTEFSGMPFKVTRGTLIPRPETEQLVDVAVEHIQKNKINNIVDIGTGTGAIIISINKKLEDQKNLNFIGTDKSLLALKVARYNATKNKAKVKFYARDFIKKQFTFLNNESWILISNPPYLTEKELKEPSIEFEPRLALYGGVDGLVPYRTLIDQVSKLEHKPKAILFEIGYKQGSALKEMAKKLSPKSVEIIQDFCGKDRIVKIEL